MKVRVITGSRADRNGLEVVHEALLKAGHESRLQNIDHGALDLLWRPDVVVLGGDRIEILEAAVHIAEARFPIAHIAGGDVTEGSADDRYRDAITALACIHFTTNHDAYLRLTQHLAKHPDDKVYATGSPAIDRIRQTSILSEPDTFAAVGLPAPFERVALICVHPNTAGRDPLADWEAVAKALSQLQMPCVILGANADPGGDKINGLWRDWAANPRMNSVFHNNVEPQLYYSLMAHCDVMVGNSSAMLYEAPCFGLPCVMVGQRQLGRIVPECCFSCPEDLIDTPILARQIKLALDTDRRVWTSLPFNVRSPYGDGQSAPRIVKALEENNWRWFGQAKEKLEDVSKAMAKARAQ